MKKSVLLCGCAALGAASAWGNVEYSTQTLDGVVNNSETYVNVLANSIVSLKGASSFPAATFNMSTSAQLVLAEGEESASVTAKDFAHGSDVVIGEGVLLTADFKSETTKGRTLIIKGEVKAVNTGLLSQQGISRFAGPGTLWVDNLQVRNGSQRAVNVSDAGQISFQNNIRVNLRGTGSTESIIQRQWGHYTFDNTTIGFWGKNPKWDRSLEGTGSTVFYNTVTFDTLDAQDGTTPRTFTYTAQSRQPTGSGRVRKINPGSAIFEFSPGWTGGTFVEGGTVGFSTSNVTLSGPVLVTGEGSSLEFPSATSVTFSGAFSMTNGTVALARAETARFSGATSVSKANLELPAATTVAFGSTFTLEEGRFSARGASPTVAGRLTFGTNAVLGVTAGRPIVASGGVTVAGPASLEIELEANTPSGVYPVIQNFGTETPLDDLTFTVAYTGPREVTIQKDGADLVALVTAPPLTWKGGNGTWSDSNWLTPNGDTVAWETGATARFLEGTYTVTLAEDVNAEYVDVRGTCTFAGEGRTLTVGLGIFNVLAGARATCGVTLATGDAFTKTGTGTLAFAQPWTAPATVNVNGGVLALAGANDWSTSTVTLKTGTTLGAAEDGATVDVKTLLPLTASTIGSGLTVTSVGEVNQDGLRNVKLYLDGVWRLPYPVSVGYNAYFFPLADIGGTGTFRPYGLSVSSGGTTTFRNLTILFEPYEDRCWMIARGYGTIDFHDVTFRYAGGDYRTNSADTNNNRMNFHGICTFDTLDALDGVTPRTMTFGYFPETSKCITIGAAEGGVRKINPGTLVFEVPASYKGPTIVEGGTFVQRNTIATSAITVMGEGSVFASEYATTAWTVPVTLSAGATFTAQQQPVFASSLTAGMGAKLVFPLTAATKLRPTTFAFADAASTLAFELTMPEALPRGSYPLLEGTGIVAADASRFSVTFPQGLPAGVEGQLVVQDGVVAYQVTASPFAPTKAVWYGTGDGVNWSDAANWDIGTVPPVGLDLVFSGVHGLTNAFDVSTTPYGNLAFSGSAGPFSLGGVNTLEVTGRVANLSFARQTFNVPVVMDAMPAIVEQTEAVGEGVAFAKSLTTVGDLQLSGSARTVIDGTATIAGEVKGINGDVRLEGTGTLTSGGTLHIASSSPSISIGVAKASFAGGFTLDTTSRRMNFTAGETTFGAGVYTTSANMSATYTIAEGATVTIPSLESSQRYWIDCDGTLNATELLQISPGYSGDWLRGAGTINAKMLGVQNNSKLVVSIARLNIGEGGLSIPTYIGVSSLRFGTVQKTTIAPCDADFKLEGEGALVFEGADGSGRAAVLHTVDTNGVPRTIDYQLGLEGAGAFRVTGAGTLLLGPNKAPFTGKIIVDDQATVALMKSIGTCSEVCVENGGVFRVDATELALPRGLTVKTGGVFAVRASTTLASATFAAGALIKPIRATHEDEVPVITLGGALTLPEEGVVGLDLTETLVTDGWTQVFDWSATGIPEGVSASRFAVLKAPAGHTGASYRIKANEQGLFVSLSGLWIMVR